MEFVRDVTAEVERMLRMADEYTQINYFFTLRLLHLTALTTLFTLFTLV